MFACCETTGIETRRGRAYMQSNCGGYWADCDWYWGMYALLPLSLTGAKMAIECLLPHAAYPTQIAMLDELTSAVHLA